MATPITDPNQKNPPSNDSNNKEFEQVYEKINVDEIDTSKLEISNTMDATNAALLQQVEEKIPSSDLNVPSEKSTPTEIKTTSLIQSPVSTNTTSTKNAIPEIKDIAAYIEATKEATKAKETQFLTQDGIDLTSIPGAFAVVPHQKGDHKLVFLRTQTPTGLIDDPKSRVKGSTYQKDGETIYTVHVDMKQHPTLRNPDGNAVDVWIIDDPKDLDDQIQAIYNGKGGGTNFGLPIKIKKSAPTTPSKKETTQSTKKEITKTKVEVNKKSDTKESVKKQPVKPTVPPTDASMNDAREAMKLKMHPTTPVTKTTPTPTSTPSTTTPKTPMQPVVSTQPVTTPVPPKSKTPEIKKEESIPPIEKKPVQEIMKEDIAKIEPVAAPTPQVSPPVKKESISTPKVEQPKVVPTPLVASTEKQSVPTTTKTNVPPIEPISDEIEPLPNPIPVFNIDKLATPKPTVSSTPVENLVGEKSIDTTPEKIPADKKPKTLEEMLEQQSKPNLQATLAPTTSSPAATTPSATGKPVGTKKRKPLLTLSKKKRIGILIALLLVAGWIGYVMFGNSGTPNNEPIDVPTTGDIQNPDDIDNEESPNEEQPTDGENPITDDNEGSTDELDNPVSDDNKDRKETTFTMEELMAKLEDLQVEARMIVNEARKVSNSDAIKFAVAALQKATSTLENIETDSKLTADQVAKDTARAEKYLQDAKDYLEIEEN